MLSAVHSQSCQCNGQHYVSSDNDTAGGAVAVVLVVAGAGAPLLAVVAGGLVGDEAAPLLHSSIWNKYMIVKKNEG